MCNPIKPRCPAKASLRLWGALLLSLIFLPAVPASAENFSFLHFSDVHAPRDDSKAVIASAQSLGPVRLAPYNVTAPAPSFALVTGDLDEFGAGSWDTYLSYWQGYKIPVYSTVGNHDDTWWFTRPLVSARHGGMPYAFDYGGCHFIALDSTGQQDPRPGFGTEELEALSAHLKQVKRDTPLFLFFHHPLSGSEWASPYDYERLLEILRPYNVALFLVGHGHSAVAMKFGSYDAVEGGTTLNNTNQGGYNIISIQDGMLRVAYRTAKDPEATKPLLEKPLTIPAPLPEPRFLSPEMNARVGGDRLRVQIALPAAGATGELILDEEKAQPLTLTNDRWEAQVDLSNQKPGVHVLRAHFNINGRATLATREFVLEKQDTPRSKWRVFPGGSIRAALAVDGNRVYAGSLNGCLYALDTADGHTCWHYFTGGEILGKPAVSTDTVYVANSNGELYAVSKDGRLRWRYSAGVTFTAPPVLNGNTVVIGAVDGRVFCIDSATGTPRWQQKVASYSIEAPACPAGDTLLVGAWDSNLYAISAADGSLRWKAAGEGSRVQAAAKYYSPADCAPVVLGGRVFAADRNYKLIFLNAATGERLQALDHCSAIAPAADGKSIYMRRYGNGMLTKIDADGKELWNCPAGLGSLPVTPAEADGLIAVTSNTGLVSAVSAANGSLLWQYQAVPGFYVPGGAQPAGGVIYVAGLDGSVSAISK